MTGEIGRRWEVDAVDFGRVANTNGVLVGVAVRVLVRVGVGVVRVAVGLGNGVSVAVGKGGSEVKVYSASGSGPVRAGRGLRQASRTSRVSNMTSSARVL